MLQQAREVRLCLQSRQVLPDTFVQAKAKRLSGRTVTLTLSTHSEGGITQLDIELAHRIEAHTP